MNMVTLEGNLTADPELRFTASGSAVTGFTVAHTPRRLNRQTQQWEDAGDTLFLRCSVWRDQAENVAESLHRGDRVLVTGRLTSRTWEDRGGNNRTVIECEVSTVAPSLARATARVTRASRAGAGVPDTVPDPWVSTPAASGAEQPF